MKNWLSGKSPLTTEEMLKNTDRARIKRAQTQVQITSYDQEFIIKKLSLWKRLKSFFTRKPVNTVFVKFVVHTVNKKNGNKHKVALVIPYLKDMNSRTLSKIPIQVYSNTADFKFRFAWELNQTNNLYTNKIITEKLGIAITEKPTKVKPLNSPQLDKHLYAVITRIDKLKIDY